MDNPLPNPPLDAYPNPYRASAIWVGHKCRKMGSLSFVNWLINFKLENQHWASQTILGSPFSTTASLLGFSPKFPCSHLQHYFLIDQFLVHMGLVSIPQDPYVGAKSPRWDELISEMACNPCICQIYNLVIHDHFATPCISRVLLMRPFTDIF